MGTIKTTNIEPIADNGTVTLGSSGDTFALASGVTQTIAVNTPTFFANLSSNQNISNDTQTKIVFDSEQFDVGNVYNPSTARYTPAYAGKSYITTTIRSATGTDFNTFQMKFKKNGSELAIVAARNENNDSIVLSGVFTHDADDYFEVFIYQESGGTIAINGGSVFVTFFSAYKIIE